MFLSALFSVLVSELVWAKLPHGRAQDYKSISASKFGADAAKGKKSLNSSSGLSGLGVGNPFGCNNLAQSNSV